MSLININISMKKTVKLVEVNFKIDIKSGDVDKLKKFINKELDVKDVQLSGVFE